ncbi:chemotaxis response regulator protein-glutamate methylesterase [Sphingoaurantiacus capsulatus]|uniref:Protein-glutamate methylesterase/protein-glutamine glutaminase n=1 Tax=Sphingoaurantiacus capsulatus TaxID=1771310 RepID=A0ABV7XDG5_9SPHN
MSASGLASTPRPAAPAAGPARVMLVDDSSVSRALMTRWIEENGAGQVVATAANGRAAVEALAVHRVEVVVLDIEMPEVDGLTALPRLLAAQPGLQVLMASTLSQHGASVTLQALRLGAADAIGKPRAGWALGTGNDFRTELAAKVRALGAVARRRPGAPAPEVPTLPPGTPEPTLNRAAPSTQRPRAIVIGASTGGPNALFRLVELLPRDVDVPIFVTQHMPPTFTTILADHLARHGRRPAHEAEDGMPAQPGHVYIAPGGRHLSLAGSPDHVRLIVSDEEPENFCRPSVNPLMRSAARLYGDGALGIMLTGMGSDGLEGARELVRAGGTLVAQDQTSSVVWGMPGSVVRAGLAAEVLPLDDIAAFIGQKLKAAR